VYINTKIETT